MRENVKGCLVCGAPLVYTSQTAEMHCVVCGRKATSNARCEAGHFVCDACHTSGTDAILGVCLSETSRDPGEILEHLMAQPFCHMHGPEHHIMVSAALLTAYANAGGDIQLEAALKEAVRRGKEVPGGICGFWGACGAGIGSGIFVSIATQSTPLSGEPFALSNLMTSRTLARIGETGGPRCCKRNSYLAIQTAAEFAKEHLGVQMDNSNLHCTRASKNAECIGERCPFSGTAKHVDCTPIGGHSERREQTNT